ncbi:MAG: pyridoxine 5'-phosphate synthase [Bacteroidota bacterium]
MATKLSVNINKVALIRNSRGSNLPDLRQFAMDCERFGAEGITVHPRPDQRHVRYDDIPILKEVVTTELNIEGYPSETFLEMVLEHQPHQCTLVPDPPGVLTSSEGWDLVKSKDFLSEVVGRLQERSIRVSLFVDPNSDQLSRARDTGTDRVELYTGTYANEYPLDPHKAIQSYTECGRRAAELGLGLNAGHDLNLTNLKYFSEHVEGVLEVSIGHALVTDALYYGIGNVIGMYKALL